MSKDILKVLRGLSPELENLKIKEIKLSRSGSAVFSMICNKAVSDETKGWIKRKLKEFLPTFFCDVVINLTKIVADRDLVAKEIMEYLYKSHMAISHSVKNENVSFSCLDGVNSYTLKLDSDIYGYFEDNDVCEGISNHLESVFCGEFNGSIANSGKESAPIIVKDKLNASDYETIKCRTFDVNDVVKLWGEEISGRAIYIADASLINGTATFAGKIVAISQKPTKTGKTFYVLEIDDHTGTIDCKVFLTKEKAKKMEKLNVGSQIIVRGELSVFNGMPSFKVDDLSYCELPVDFKPVEREGKPVPVDYSLVFPQPLVEVTQSFLFSEERKTEPCMIGKTFVVLDIETTGVHYVNGDKITEIGAVRIVDGKIVDKFQTLVNPQVKLTEEIINLTGITDDMLVDAPTFDKVIPDLYKYVDGACIVAHNLEFDYKFIKYMAKDCGYVFKNDGIDTLALSREVVRGLKNYKLNTVCGHFGIEFQHHRALSDAHATAKLLLELVAIKKSLPI